MATGLVGTLPPKALVDALKPTRDDLDAVRHEQLLLERLGEEAVGVEDLRVPDQACSISSVLSVGPLHSREDRGGARSQNLDVLAAVRDRIADRLNGGDAPAVRSNRLSGERDRKSVV